MAPIDSVPRPLPRRPFLRLLMAGIALSFFGTLVLTASLFPEPYDWRFRVISSLASPHDNPHYYRLASAGLALTGLLLLPFAPSLRDHCSPQSPRLAQVACWLHRLGALCLVMTALISGRDRWFGLRHLHAHWAQLAGFFLGAAFLGWACGLLASRSFLLHPRLKFLLATLAILPTAGILLSRIALNIVYARASRAAYETYNHSLAGSLALWEWIGAVCLYLFLLLFTLADAEEADYAPRNPLRILYTLNGIS